MFVRVGVMVRVAVVVGVSVGSGVSVGEDVVVGRGVLVLTVGTTKVGGTLTTRATRNCSTIPSR